MHPRSLRRPRVGGVDTEGHVRFARLESVELTVGGGERLSLRGWKSDESPAVSRPVQCLELAGSSEVAGASEDGSGDVGR